MMGPAESNLSVGEVLAALRRQKWKMAVFFLFVMAAVTVSTAMTESRYESVAKLFVRLGRENVALDPTATLGQAWRWPSPGRVRT